MINSRFKQGVQWSLGVITATALLACTGSETPGNDGTPILLDAPSTPAVTGAKVEFPQEIPLETDQETLDAALHCSDFEHPDKPAVLLVHGTFTRGQEQYEWNYIPQLAERGHDVCVITYPDRGLGDQQISAEYVVNALRRMHARTGQKVAMIGHSQGASMPRWALRFWPSARAAVDDFVLHAGPNHGVLLGNVTQWTQVLGGLRLLPEGVYQFGIDANFTRAVNTVDETPGAVDYTAIYTQFDELVQPTNPIPTAALDWGIENPKVTNIKLQDICPGYIADHVTIGLTDRLTFTLTMDAIDHPGPANVERAGGADLCSAVAPLPNVILGPQSVAGLLRTLASEGVDSIPRLHLATQEPPLKPYAQAALDEAESNAPAAPDTP
ncbi:triacylglycerol lipase [Sinimarinibacterium sp. NLF-5-8]|uniref:esterase/lipase family protein n=1 Tax=Sinimarinibacterium sp. NLF-5-8 TaxID=2698684 RepID=UPI00137B952B|nr:alpha/beta fold hydrolase [Sinimarinibacterium sp. NLF-5-8]QHS11289.1 alpha/beta fold hydrolase [Sinimarinibacterium sp. NLF-5-8]